MSIHDGHRQRLKERFRSEGLDNFNDIQVLELLLFYAVPRQDTNPIAHALLERFGTLAQVLEAPVSELEKVKGVGHNAAVLPQKQRCLHRACRYLNQRLIQCFRFRRRYCRCLKSVRRPKQYRKACCEILRPSLFRKLEVI